MYYISYILCLPAFDNKPITLHVEIADGACGKEIFSNRHDCKKKDNATKISHDLWLNKIITIVNHIRRTMDGMPLTDNVLVICS